MFGSDQCGVCISKCRCISHQPWHYHDPSIFPSSKHPLMSFSQPHGLIHVSPKASDPFAAFHTSNAHDLPTNTTCLTYDTHVTSLMMLWPKHSNAPSLVSCMCTSNTLQTLSLVVCSYLIYDLRLPTSYNYMYDYLYRLWPMTSQTCNLTYASCT